jgi:hypothetical protein
LVEVTEANAAGGGRERAPDGALVGVAYERLEDGVARPILGAVEPCAGVSPRGSRGLVTGGTHGKGNDDGDDGDRYVGNEGVRLGVSLFLKLEGSLAIDEARFSRRVTEVGDFADPEYGVGLPGLRLIQREGGKVHPRGVV